MTRRHLIAVLFTCSYVTMVGCTGDGVGTESTEASEAQRWSVGEGEAGRGETPSRSAEAPDTPADTAVDPLEGPAPEVCDPSHPCEAEELSDRSQWPGYWRGLEEGVVALVNARRAAGADCGGGYGVRSPVPPVAEDRLLSEAARLHAVDLAQSNRLAHNGSDGSVFWERAQATGFDGTAEGEAVAGGYPTAAEVVESWMTSPDHCAVLMLSHSDQIGVGYVFRRQSSYGHFWSLTMGQRTVR